MTVEQPALPQHKIHTQRSRDGDTNYLLAKVKEVTGIHDETIISQACEACKDSNGKIKVDDVVAVLLNDDSLHSKPKSKVIALPPREDLTKNVQIPPSQSTIDARGQSGFESKNVSTQKQDVPFGPLNKNQAGVIDLTSESGDQDEIQKAIAASLQESPGIGILGGQISREEQDISRILEQSLAESKAGTKRKRGDIWFVDPLNPHERKRQDGCPVGLKNVGNTCWFSAVIQSLFHLRKFRHLVLNFKVPKEVQANSTESRNLRFMQELRYLFALMVGSQKKYVDPSKAVEILKEAFSSTAAPGIGDSQQDVSEFQHKLLEWLEDAFKSHSSRLSLPSQGGSNDTETGEREKNKNPMVELFYGQYRAEGTNEGKGFSNEETFGQFPLQVNGFRDIHESLEATTAQGEIETISNDASQKSGQELWFTRLPPVLTFELSRFQFNQQLGRPEKIHNKIEFPHVIYMDRYLDCNKLITRQRREKMKKLMDELNTLYAKLDKFNHYGSGSKKVPLQDVLSYALEFAQSKPNASTSQDVEMESPIKSTSETVSESNDSGDRSSDMIVHSPCKISSDVTMMTVSPKCNKQSPPSPSPRHVDDTELKVLQDCLHRWRTEVEQDVKQLQDKINNLEKNVNGMYTDEVMKRCPYHLHAVLVHEGQAASGHYWAYIYDSLRKEWLKFNDITVNTASWDDLVKECVGGYHNASAYCLMYVGQSHFENDSITDMPTQSDLQNLPDDLKEIVTEDNNKFAQEIVNWDEAQKRSTAMASSSCTVTGGGGGDAGIKTENRSTLRSALTSTSSTQTPVDIKSTLPVQHAEMVFEETMRQLSCVIELETFANKGAEVALRLAIQTELNTMEQIVKTLPQKMPREDPRLKFPIVYFKSCSVPSRIIERVLHEQFSYCPLMDGDERAKEIKKAAIRKLEQQLNTKDGDQLEKHTLMWHERYHQFRKITFFFVRGLQYFNEERYDQALLYLVHSYSLNTTINDTAAELRGLQGDLVNFYRRQCLLHLNDIATSQFENQDDISESLKLMNDLVVPCLPFLLSSPYKDDVSAGEEMREKWCSFLGQEICDKKIEKLQDLMSKLFDPPAESKNAQIPGVTPNNLKDLYKDYLAVMDIAHQSGYIERAAKSTLQ